MSIYFALFVQLTDRLYTLCLRRGGRVVEGAALEKQYAGNRIEGSNPSLSASLLIQLAHEYNA